MLLNCNRCKKLTVDYVNSATGLELHRFLWLDGEHEIGAIRGDWNHLVGVQSLSDPQQEPPMLHWTPWRSLSGPNAPWEAHLQQSGFLLVMTP